jgi:hypothetical protein
MVRPQRVDDHEQQVELLIVAGVAVARVAGHAWQQGGSGGAGGTGPQELPAAQARLHAAGE